MATHTMAKDGLTLEVLSYTKRNGKLSMPALNRIKMTYNGDSSSVDDLGQLLRDMGRHVVVLRPLGLGRVEVESSTGSKVPIRVLARNARAAWGSVREQDRDALTSGYVNEASLLGPMSCIKL